MEGVGRAWRVPPLSHELVAQIDAQLPQRLQVEVWRWVCGWRGRETRRREARLVAREGFAVVHEEPNAARLQGEAWTRVRHGG